MGSIGILVGGGPAPGINGVISAATLAARQQGARVIGILQGFEWLMQGNIDHIVELDEAAVSRILWSPRCRIHRNVRFPAFLSDHGNIEICTRRVFRYTMFYYTYHYVYYVYLLCFRLAPRAFFFADTHWEHSTSP